MAQPMAAPWSALLDDTAALPPAAVSVAEAVTTHHRHHQEWYAGLLGSLAAPDTALGELPAGLAVTAVVTGGAGSLRGVLRQGLRARWSLAGVVVALRDPHDLPGNARRVVAALDACEDEGLREEDGVPVRVELPATPAHHGWLAAVDVLAERELPAVLRLAGPDPAASDPATLATWVEAALDRETPYAFLGGGGHAVSRRGPDGGVRYGVVNLLLATREAFDGAGAEAVSGWLAETDPARLRARWDEQGGVMAGARRWCLAYGTGAVGELAGELAGLGLLEIS